MRVRYFSAIVVFLTLPLTTLHAGILSVSGDLTQIAAPPSVAVGALEDNTNGRIFVERADYVLPSAVSVDVDGTLGLYNELADLTGGTVAAGTSVDSYLLHFDPDFGNPSYAGSVQFDSTILAVIVLSASLDGSDAVLGAPGTTYQSGLPRRGLDLADFTILDSITLANSTTLQFDIVSGNQMDHIRVLTSTATVPEPSTFTLLLVAAAPLAWSARTRLGRRRRSEPERRG